MSDPSMSTPNSSDPISTFTLASLSGALSDLVTRTASGVVSVHSHHSRASGFVWRPGLIITANEALAEDGEIAVVLPGGESVPATLAGRDPTTDVALLRIGRADLQTATLTPDPVAAGALAIVVGAQDGAPVAALGVVSMAGGGWRSLRGGEIDARIELDVSLRRSSEGGVALDASGRAFGMAVFGPRRRVLIIPSATVDRVAAKLETHGRIARGYLGLGLQPVRLDDGGVGAMVMSVDAKGPGAVAGVRQGDMIVAWNGQSIRSIRTLLRALGADSVGSSVKLSLKRAGEPAEVSLTIRERPAA
ncbi:serine protease, S1-C subfamily, contains C-terminal PDZ domain [Rhizobiales bacterium GAS188]|nr:serine protease, S1-C subfamily, contains C-terminal PDZ domain [Rhizobiales bacterium GAS188]